jgi:hypothetical protein
MRLSDRIGTSTSREGVLVRGWHYLLSFEIISSEEYEQLHCRGAQCGKYSTTFGAKVSRARHPHKTVTWKGIQHNGPEEALRVSLGGNLGKRVVRRLVMSTDTPRNDLAISSHTTHFPCFFTAYWSLLPDHTKAVCGTVGHMNP